MKKIIDFKVLQLLALTLLVVALATSCEDEPINNYTENTLTTDDTFQNSDSLLYKEVDSLLMRQLDTKFYQNVLTKDSLYIINTLSEYNRLFPLCTLSDFDITRNTLFAIRGIEPYCIIDKSMYIRDSTTGYDFIFDVEIGDCTTPGSWLFLFYTNRKIYANQVYTVVVNR